MLDDPGNSAARAVAVEPHAEPSMFAHGICAGVATVAVLVHVWFALEFAAYRDIYRELGGNLQILTRIVISQAWLQGVPVVGAIGIAALVWKRPRRLRLYAMPMALLLVTAVATYWYATSPVFEIAGNISAG